MPNVAQRLACKTSEAGAGDLRRKRPVVDLHDTESIMEWASRASKVRLTSMASHIQLHWCNPGAEG
ncbi:hypothetical protein N7462_001021 [Penicillium macrosclerotiorum]|uniref:uncharacterized protein n=1 Tax=Penicillium macrosclerotiorum TaxID=303699 RepID=UPI00254832F9|nr:uncharacterized protein N7462_001021 [Penicillium macrosclerotiorum]KAJ5699016.1 hypothetical protein N7462_001021 [Penicillium macrosclerotiorum]